MAMGVPRQPLPALGLGLVIALATAGLAHALDTTALDLVRADLASGAFAQAQSRADSILRRRAPPDLRAMALVLAGDAAYGMGAHRLAAERYAEALLSDELPPDAPHAALALGWAELRLGRREDARRTWMRVARQFPAAPEAPIALILAAELSARTGEAVVARKLLDRVQEGHPATPAAEIAQLSRAIMALRDGRTQEGVGGLRILARSGGPSVPEERRKLLDALLDSEAGAGPERQMLLTDRYAPRLAGVTARPQRQPGDSSDSPPRSSTAPPTRTPRRACSTPCSSSRSKTRRGRRWQPWPVASSTDSRDTHPRPRCWPGWRAKPPPTRNGPSSGRATGTR